MAGWVPQKGQRYFSDVEVVEVAERRGKTFVKYEPLFTQQRAARHELELGTFLDYFGPLADRENAVAAGSHWRMAVEVLDFSGRDQRVRFRFESRSGVDLGGGDLPILIFNATFGPGRKGTGAAEGEPAPEGADEKARSLADVRTPRTGEAWHLRVTVLSIDVSEQSGIHVKYRPVELPGLVSRKELPERDFVANFENENHGMTDINVGATWVMRVKVVDVDEREDGVFYRRETGSAEGRSIIKRMSTHVFVSSFAPPPAKLPGS